MLQWGTRHPRQRTPQSRLEANDSVNVRGFEILIGIMHEPHRIKNQRRWILKVNIPLDA